MAAWLIVITTDFWSAVHGPAPSGSAEVRRSVTLPKELAVGVNFTVSGLEVKEVLLSVPLPETIDHWPEVVPPLTVAPVKVTAPGVAD